LSYITLALLTLRTILSFDCLFAGDTVFNDRMAGIHKVGLLYFKNRI